MQSVSSAYRKLGCSTYLQSVICLMLFCSWLPSVLIHRPMKIKISDFICQLQRKDSRLKEQVLIWSFSFWSTQNKARSLCFQQETTTKVTKLLPSRNWTRLRMALVNWTNCIQNVRMYCNKYSVCKNLFANIQSFLCALLCICKGSWSSWSQRSLAIYDRELLFIFSF